MPSMPHLDLRRLNLASMHVASKASAAEYRQRTLGGQGRPVKLTSGRNACLALVNELRGAFFCYATFVGNNDRRLSAGEVMTAGSLLQEYLQARTRRGAARHVRMVRRLPVGQLRSGGRYHIVIEPERVGGVVGLLDGGQARVALRAVNRRGVGRLVRREVVDVPSLGLPGFHAVEQFGD